MVTKLVNLDEIENKPLTLRFTISTTLFSQLVSYAVIVEGWEKRTFGRVKRAWLQTFSEEERATAATYYRTFYDWHLVKGPPDHVALQVKTLNLLQRVSNFFGSI